MISFEVNKLHNTRSFDYDDKRVFYGLPKKPNDTGFEIRLYGDDPCVYGKALLGSIDLVKTRFGFYETHCSLECRSYQNKGYGIALYSKAIELARKKKIELRSSTCFSDKAKRLWCSKRLRSKFKIKKCGKRFKVIGEAK